MTLILLIKCLESSNVRKSTEDDLDFLYARHGYPVDIVIRMKDGSEYCLKSAMKLTRKELGNGGTEIRGSTYTHRIILSYNKNDIIEYYTILSSEAAQFISDTSDIDFPKVDAFSITPEGYKFGDIYNIKITI
ncbi:MAG: hypothetical protein ACOYWZ_01950 [Bacillota bacterium]